MSRDLSWSNQIRESDLEKTQSLKIVGSLENVQSGMPFVDLK